MELNRRLVEVLKLLIKVNLPRNYLHIKVVSDMNDIELWQGDCLELMNNIPDKSVDIILADLPYGVLNKKNKNAK